jgi:hypothetical protein
MDLNCRICPDCGHISELFYHTREECLEEQLTDTQLRLARAFRMQEDMVARLVSLQLKIEDMELGR